jgi:type I restriction enzyme S subunit
MSANWPATKLAEVLTPIARTESVDRAKEYRLLGVRLEGRGPFLRETVRGTQTSASKLHRVEAGDFIYSRLFACRGAFGVIDKSLDGCYVSGEFPTFRAVPSRIDLDYLKYWFRLPDVIASVDEKCTGSTPLTRNRFKEHFFLALEVPLPQLPEQQRIVARIEKLAGKIETARRLRKQAAEEAEALVSRATASIVDDERWPKSPLAELLAEPPRNGLGPQPEVESGGRMMLRINAVSSTLTRFVDMSATKRVQVVEEVAKPFVIADNDVFIVRYNGDINRVAKPAIYKGGNEERIAYPDKLIRLRPNPARMTPDFLVFALKSRRVRQQIETLGKTTAGNIGVSGSNAKSFVLSVPPLPEQHRIVKEMDALQLTVDSLEQLQSETSTALDALLPSILDRAFKGEL